MAREIIRLIYFYEALSVLYDFSIFCNSLLQLMFLVIVFIICTVFRIVYGISWRYAVMFSSRVIIIIAIVIITWRGSVMWGLLLSGFPCAFPLLQFSCNCVSAMSHPRSGILLLGTVFFSFSDFSYLFLFIQLTDFFCHGHLLNISAVDLCCVSLVVLDLYLVLS